MNKKAFIYLLLTLIINSFIWVQSLFSGYVSSAQSGFFTNLIVNFFSIFKVSLDKAYVSYTIRKLAHFTEFFLLGLLLFKFLFEMNFRRTVYFTFYYGFFVALTDEFIQNFSDGRAMLYSDVLIDLAGVVLAILVSITFIKIKKYKEIKNEKRSSGI